MLAALSYKLIVQLILLTRVNMVLLVIIIKRG